MKARYKHKLSLFNIDTWKELSVEGERMNIHIGDKVKLNYESIINDVDYSTLSKEYKQWVEKNKDNIFTVIEDEKFKPNQHKFSSIVSLKEDTTEPKWLFSTVNLIKIGEDN